MRKMKSEEDHDLPLIVRNEMASSGGIYSINEFDELIHDLLQKSPYESGSSFPTSRVWQWISRAVHRYS